MQKLNIFFDVDLTLVTAFLELRPFTREVFEALRHDGHTVYIWSAGGKEYSEFVMERHGLHDVIAGCFSKRSEVPVEIHFSVDDLKEFVDPYGGYVIRPFVGFGPNDAEMLEVYCRVHDVAPRDEGHHHSVAHLIHKHVPARRMHTQAV